MQADLRDVSGMAVTCKNLNVAVEDGMLWQQLFSRHHPLSQFTATNMSGTFSFFHPGFPPLCFFFVTSLSEKKTSYQTNLISISID
jgi:hypothetical protein